MKKLRLLTVKLSSTHKLTKVGESFNIWSGIRVNIPYIYKKGQIHCQNPKKIRHYFLSVNIAH